MTFHIYHRLFRLIPFLLLGGIVQAQSIEEHREDTSQVLINRFFDFVAKHYDSLNSSNFAICKNGKEKTIYYSIISRSKKLEDYQVGELRPFKDFMAGIRVDTLFKGWNSVPRKISFVKDSKGESEKCLEFSIYPFVTKDKDIFLWLQGFSPGIDDSISTHLYFRFNSRMEITGFQILDIIY